MSKYNQSISNILRLQDNLKKLEKELANLSNSFMNVNKGKVKMEPIYILIKTR